MSDCTTYVVQGDDLKWILDEVPDRSVVCLAPGSYQGGIQLRKSVILKGLGSPDEVIIDADDEQRVITVDASGVEVSLERLTLRGGRANAGGALALKVMAKVTLRECILCENESYQVGSGAIYGKIGTLLVERCRIVDNEGPGGTAIRADKVVQLTLKDSLVVGSSDAGRSVLTILDGAKVLLEHCTVAASSGAALHMIGTTSRHPSLEVLDSILVGHPTLANDTLLPGSAQIARSLLTSSPQGPCQCDDLVRIDDPQFASDSDEPYRPTLQSPSAGIAQGGGVDLVGNTHPETGATAGALEAGEKDA